jgi:CheY-like chemotaxis protein
MQSNSPVVLIVADHQDSLAMYAFGLLAMGFQPVTTADNANDGFALACQFHPDVVVADVRLPDTSWLELTHRVRTDPRTKHAVIIALADPPAGASTRQAREAGCDGVLLKPCLPDALARAIRYVLVNRRRAV